MPPRWGLATLSSAIIPSEPHAATPAHKNLHLILDNYATHKRPKVQRWMKRHPRFQVHCTPTNSSWMNNTVQSV